MTSASANFHRYTDSQWNAFRRIITEHQQWLMGRAGQRAELRDVDFTGVSLRGVRLDRATLTGVNFTDADLKSASFVDADMSGCDLSHADGTGANFTRANMKRAVLSRAVLGRTRLLADEFLSSAEEISAMSMPIASSGDDLESRPANLCEALLDGADLSDAILSGADLTLTSLKGARLRGTHLVNTNLSTAIFSDATQFKVRPGDVEGARFQGDFLPAAMRATILELNGRTRADVTARGRSVHNAALLLSVNEIHQDELDVMVEAHRSFFQSGGTSDEPLELVRTSGVNLNASHHRLAGAKFLRCELRGFNFAGSDLRNARFIGCGLDGCNFAGADLRGANFRFSTLRGADLRSAKLYEHRTEQGVVRTDFFNADLEEALVEGAELDDAEGAKAPLLGMAEVLPAAWSEFRSDPAFG